MSDRKENSMVLTKLQKGALSDLSETAADYVPDRKLYLLKCQDFEKSKFEQALCELTNAHPMLLSWIDKQNERQVIEDEKSIFNKIAYEQISGECTSLNIKSIAEDFFVTKCNPAALMLIKVLFTGDKHALIFILTDGNCIDGMSQEIIIRDLNRAYEGQKLAKEHSYADFLKIQAEKMRTDEYYSAGKYWDGKIEKLSEPFEFSDLDMNEQVGNKTYQQVSVLSQQDYTKIEAYARGHGLTIFGFLLAIYCKVLGKYSSQKSFLINLPISSRPYDMDGIFNTVGMCSDFMLFEYEKNPNTSLSEMAQSVQMKLFEYYEHSAFSGADVLKELRKKKEKAVTVPYTFTSLLDTEVYSDDSFTKIFSRVETKNVNMEVIVSRCNGEIHITMVCKEHFAETQIPRKIMDLYTGVLKKFAADDTFGDNCDIGIPEEDRALINHMNSGQVELGKKTLAKMLFESFVKNDKRIAIADDNCEYNYRELLALVKKIIYAMEQIPNLTEIDTIGLYLNKGIFQIASAIASIFTNKTFMPIEISLPEEDIKYCLENAEITFVITESCNKDKFAKENIALLILDETDMEYECKALSLDELNHTVIINTSGSTGRPKSVWIPESGIINCILHSKKVFEMDQDTAMLAVTNYCHDMAIFDTLAPIIYGGRVIIPNSKKEKDPRHWAELMIRYKVNAWNSVPALMDMLLSIENNDSVQAVQGLKAVIMGGGMGPAGADSENMGYKREC